MKVLVIDDARTIRTVARLSLLRLGGMSVIEAADGVEGLAMARRERPDAILLDVQMPEMDGPATLHALRQDPLTARIPVVFMTAQPSLAEVRRLRGLGAVDVVAKPFDPRYLYQQVTAFVRESAYASVG